MFFIGIWKISLLVAVFVFAKGYLDLDLFLYYHDSLNHVSVIYLVVLVLYGNIAQEHKALNSAGDTDFYKHS